MATRRSGGWWAGAVIVPLLVSSAAFGQPALQEKPELVLQTGHTLSINAVAYSPDGRWLATASADRTVKIWEATTGLEVRTLTHSGVVWTLAFRPPDGRWLASAGGDGMIRLWEVSTGQEVHTWQVTRLQSILSRSVRMERCWLQGAAIPRSRSGTSLRGARCGRWADTRPG